MDEDLLHAMNVAIECNEVGCILFSAGQSQAALEMLKGSTRLVSAVSEFFGLPRHHTNVGCSVKNNRLPSAQTCMENAQHHSSSNLTGLNRRPPSIQVILGEGESLLRRAQEHLTRISNPSQCCGCSLSGSSVLCGSLDKRLYSSKNSDAKATDKYRNDAHGLEQPHQNERKVSEGGALVPPQEPRIHLLSQSGHGNRSILRPVRGFQPDQDMKASPFCCGTSIHSVCFQRAIQKAEEAGKIRRLEDKEAEARSDCFIFQEPLRLLPYEPTSTSCMIESATIFFNLGLVYHLYGSYHSQQQKALSLYKISWTLACSAGLQDTRSHLVAMASLNNAAHIHHSLFDYHLSRRYLETLRQYIISLPRATDSHATTTRQRFAINAMLLNEPKVAKAA